MMAWTHSASGTSRTSAYRTHCLGYSSLTLLLQGCCKLVGPPTMAHERREEHADLNFLHSNRAERRWQTRQKRAKQLCRAAQGKAC